jgi:hypothetical protein
MVIIPIKYPTTLFSKIASNIAYYVRINLLKLNKSLFIDSEFFVLLLLFSLQSLLIGFQLFETERDRQFIRFFKIVLFHIFKYL